MRTINGINQQVTGQRTHTTVQYYGITVPQSCENGNSEVTDTDRQRQNTQSSQQCEKQKSLHWLLGVL